MKLDFTFFPQAYSKSGGQRGTGGTTNVYAAVSVPPGEKKRGTEGDKTPASEKLSPLSPLGKNGGGTEIPFVYAGVPLVPLVPHKKVDVCADEAPLDDLRHPFVGWLDDRIHLDARGIALRQTPTWSTTVDALHADFVRWVIVRDQAPPARDQFLSLLGEAGSDIREVHGEQLVSHVALREDMQAHEQFQRLPMSSDPEQPVPEPLPVPATPIVSAPEGIALPVGVRLVSWQPVQPPICLSECSTVTDTDKFVRVTLGQLNAQLRGKKFLDGGWGLSGLLARLEVCGVLVEIEDPGETY